MKRNSYNTKQKNEILSIIKKKKHEFTVQDILNDKDCTVGLTTIYRFINKMVLDGNISKSIGNDNVMYYQLLDECNKENHFYLKCESCKEMIHIDCDCINVLKEHISKEHDFSLSSNHIVVNGVCSSCMNRGGKK